MIAIIDPFSGIAGDMTLGALVELGLDPEFLRALPARLGIDGVQVHVRRVSKAGIMATKVDFEIPPQPHGRHLSQLERIVDACDAPDVVKARAKEAFRLIATVEAAVHGMPVEKVHLHEVGAVDAILDVVGSLWGFHLLGVTDVHTTPITVGHGTVTAAHGVMPVPAPATLDILAGMTVRPGPEGSGELTTPTGAALLRVLQAKAPPREYVSMRAGYGAGTKDLRDRANVVRITLAEVAGGNGGGGGTEPETRELVLLAADVDDQPGEYLAAAADALRDAGALDVVLVPTVMKKGRPGTRIEVLAAPTDVDALERMLFTHTTTVGVRRTVVVRRALHRTMLTVHVGPEHVRVKAVALPDGSWRAKPEFDDVQAASTKLGRPAAMVAAEALHAAQHALAKRPAPAAWSGASPSAAPARGAGVPVDPSAGGHHHHHHHHDHAHSHDHGHPHSHDHSHGHDHHAHDHEHPHGA